MHIHEASARQVTHPILIVAAVAVVLFCSVGTAAILGWLPSSSGSGYQPVPAIQRAAPAVAPPPAQPAPAAPAQLAQPGMEPMLAQQTAQPAMLAAAQPAEPVPQPAAQAAPPAVAPAPHCGNCGVIVAIHEVRTRGQGSGLGAAGGAVLGGLLGNQVGGGHGRQLATIAGAVGGAVAGNQIEGNMKSTHSYKVVVRMDNGRTRTVHLQSAQNWRTGDPVRIVNGTLRTAR